MTNFPRAVHVISKNCQTKQGFVAIKDKERATDLCIAGKDACTWL